MVRKKLTGSAKQSFLNRMAKGRLAKAGQGARKGFRAGFQILGKEGKRTEARLRRESPRRRIDPRSVKAQVRGVKLFKKIPKPNQNLSPGTRADILSSENVDFLGSQPGGAEGGFMLSDDNLGSEVFVPRRMRDL